MDRNLTVNVTSGFCVEYASRMCFELDCPRIVRFAPLSHDSTPEGMRLQSSQRYMIHTDGFLPEPPLLAGIFLFLVSQQPYFSMNSTWFPCFFVSFAAP